MLRFTPTTVTSGLYVRLELDVVTPSYNPERNRAVYDRFFTQNSTEGIVQSQQLKSLLQQSLNAMTQNSTEGIVHEQSLRSLLKHSLNAMTHIQTPEVIPPLDGPESSSVTLLGFENRYTLVPTEDQFNAICKDNPWAVFSECVAENCALNRLERHQLRDGFQHMLVTTVRERCIKPELTLVFYMSGYLFNELAIITELGRSYHLHVHLIMDRGEYLSLLVAPEHNPRAAEGKMGFEFTEPNPIPGRASWFQGYTYRYLKVLEWCQSLDIKVDLTVYDSTEAFTEASVAPDVCVGIDYIDNDLVHQLCTFIETVLALPVPHMLVASLRTNGVCSAEVALECRLRGYATLPLNTPLALKEQLRAETVQVETDKYDTEIERDGVRYTVADYVITATCRYHTYISERGRQLMKEIAASVNTYQSQLVLEWIHMESLW